MPDLAPGQDWSEDLRPAGVPRPGMRAPLPIPDLGQTFAVLFDVLPVLDQLVLELLLDVGALGSGLRQAVDGIHHEVEAIHLVEHRLSSLDLSATRVPRPPSHPR